MTERKATGQSESQIRKQYKLYASRNLQAPSGIEFSLIPCCSNGKYILIYTDKQLDNSYKEINPNTKLEPEERTWLAECNAELVRKKIETNVNTMKENEEEYATMLNKFCDKLAEELKVERILLSKENTKKIKM